MFQINNTKDDYIVEVFNTRNSHWEPIANFGDNQGDAIFFKNHDAPKLPEEQIKDLVKDYDPEMIFHRLDSGIYHKGRSMRKGHYYLTTIRERNFVDAGKNKREAIKAGREMALKEGQSVELWHCEPVKDVPGALGRYYVGMLEFPYYLRSCQLTAKDITVNI